MRLLLNTCIAWRTRARVHVDLVVTRGSVLTRIRGAFIEIGFTVSACFR